MTINVEQVSAMFIAQINEPGVQDLGDKFFAVHDCIHWYTDLGVSVPEERIVGEIQLYMLGSSKGALSAESRFYITRLFQRGVYSELKELLKEARKGFFANI